MAAELRRQIVNTLTRRSKFNLYRSVVRHKRHVCSKCEDIRGDGQTQSPNNENNRNLSLGDSLVDPPFPEFPSDIETQKNLKLEREPIDLRPKVNPETTTILLFPGQGSQFIGMGAKLLAYPGVEEMYDTASTILGYNLLDVCINGPANKLNSTLYCQPAILVTSLAAMEKLKEEYPNALEHVVGTAGFSVGEFSALVASGSLTFEDAVHLVDLRAKSMQRSCDNVPGGMMTIFCDRTTALRTAMVAAKEFCRQKFDLEEPVCSVANYLCTEVKVVAGHEEALRFLEQYGREWGIKRTKRLPVSGAFHTQLMRHGGSKHHNFTEALNKTPFEMPNFPLYTNLDGRQYVPRRIGMGVRPLVNILKSQCHKPVLWEQTIHTMYKRPVDTPFPHTFEVGPGRQLGTLLRNINNKAYKSYKNIEV